MKLETIISPIFAKAFGNLLGGETISLSPKTIFRLKKIHVKLRDEHRIFNEMKNDWAKELADKDEKGEAIIIDNAYKIPDDKMIILQEKVNDALKLEVDIGAKIPFEDIEKVKLSVKDLIVLEDLILDPKE